ncbi:competence type IV pilus ATPase ComGA [Vagococcus salmoninarum]|uniref:Bacterial type II secretion system protein E domain-containing protein n=1 Tax=Vagococcus salmoninarum TaxID=2739 RepID=A0A429ZHE4_9ENTE|nr:competence type IV pilus ATPase ComGA [Vagococcus salmoninarum]RST93087.1 hypothetical protein CBF35_12490 [Vagococcus salmoninarum]
MKELARQLLLSGFRNQASDLYFFPNKATYQVSYRFHQQHYSYGKLSRKVGEQLIQYFKYLAEMDVAEKRRVQVGAATITIKRKKYRIRLSTVSDFNNQESLVIRFLHELRTSQELVTFSPQLFYELQQKIQQSGLFLFAGPTGSGKTTTMYQLANTRKNHEKQVITIEDPVEIQGADFLQLQVNPKIGATYEQLIKACLRHRPDILIIGEIRDEETAKSVIRGALTGHTIFSTIHGLDKYSVIARLLELGVSREDLRQCLRGVVYQKIIPVACPYCVADCSLYCHRRKSGVLLDSWFDQEGIWEAYGKEDTWHKGLWKIWQLGFINEKTYQEHSPK